MKISELVNKLNEIEKKVGDMEVKVFDETKNIELFENKETVPFSSLFKNIGLAVYPISDNDYTPSKSFSVINMGEERNLRNVLLIAEAFEQK